MIPKKIHYCWFGRGEKPQLAQKCISSWERYMPDYEIIEWNEDNFDINMNAYTRMCYEQKKYAFLTDYIRLIVIEKYGGIYFDTDVEAVQCFDNLLNNKLFIGFETEQYVNTGQGFGAEAHHPIVQQMIKEYEPLLDGQHGIIGCPHLNTNSFLKFGLKQNGRKQMIVNAMVYPSDYFNPLSSATGKLEQTENTYSIHWYSMSWMSSEQKVRSKITRTFHRIFGEDCFRFLKKGVQIIK
jgi:mannosyltransferase OCH1-like enzyme